MIMSGWILPDMHEVKCESYSSTKAHLRIVKEYLAKLRIRDFNLYSEIMQEFFKLRLRRNVLDLEDFVVIKLGWIKILNCPVKMIFYSPDSPVEFLVKRYLKLGYTPIAVDDNRSIIHINIPSQELI